MTEAATETSAYLDALRLAVCRQLLRAAGARRVLLRDREGAPCVDVGEPLEDGAPRFWRARLLLDGGCLVLYSESREALDGARKLLIRAAEELESAVEVHAP